MAVSDSLYHHMNRDIRTAAMTTIEIPSRNKQPTSHHLLPMFSLFVLFVFFFKFYFSVVTLRDRRLIYRLAMLFIIVTIFDF
jgi:hypothetical protein